MALPSNLSDWLKSLPIPWLVSRDNGVNDCNAQGAVYDDQVEQLREAVKARMPLSCPADALPAIGSDRQLIQGALESEDDFRARCKAVWEQWELAGTWAELLFQLCFTCGFDAASTYIVQQNGLVYNLSADPGPTTDPTTLLEVNELGLNYNIADGAGYPWWTFDNRDDLCARFAIIIDNGWRSYSFDSVQPQSIYGFSDTDAYAVGLGGRAGHFDGSSWTVQTISGAGSLYCVWGYSAAEVWAVGSAGKMYKSTDGGTTWVSQTSPTAGQIKGMWGSSALDIWMAETTTKKVWHTVDGGANWTLNTTLTNGNVGSVWGTSADDVFIALTTYGYAHWDGATWTEVAYNPTGSRTAMFGIGNEHWICGSGTTTGGIARIDNAYATTTVEPTPSYSKSVTWIYGTSADYMFAGVADAGATNGAILKRQSDDTWTLFHRFATGIDPTGLWVSPSGFVWATCSNNAIYMQPPLNAALIGKVVKTWKPAKAKYMGLIAVAEGILWGWPPGTKWGDVGLTWGASVGVHVGP